MDSFHKFLKIVYLENNTLNIIKIGKFINHDATDLLLYGGGGGGVSRKGRRPSLKDIVSKKRGGR